VAKRETKFIFVTGGVVSSLGKGIAGAATAAILKSRGYKVRMKKIDPYLNVDPGTMSPTQHGEVFVTNDGGETDLDLGHYERFAGVQTSKKDNITTGRVYLNVLEKERKGDYLGRCIQVIPHVTDEIKEFIKEGVGEYDFIFIEIGGTVGDIEVTPYLEAIRQFGNDYGRENCVYMHLTLLPNLEKAGEIKTKPTQHSVKELLSFGIQPQIVLCRSKSVLSKEHRDKIALFCNVSKDRVISAPDVDNIYKVPHVYHEHGLDKEILKCLHMRGKTANLTTWKNVLRASLFPEAEVTIGVVGKYINLLESYKSLIEALDHGGIANKCKVNLKWIDAEKVDKSLAEELLHEVDGILIPGGFGERGTTGKILSARYARKNDIPFFGICFGMQMAVVDYARDVAKLKGANSTELVEHPEHKIISLIEEWDNHHKGTKEKRDENSDLGGTMRLGAYPCKLKKGSLVQKIYGKADISERHRHRYEVNIHYKKQLEKAGLVFSGMSPDGNLPEIIEIADHTWFVGVQFHPEFKSKPTTPHPLFASFVKAAIKKHRERMEKID
jgi:CTP synthase